MTDSQQPRPETEQDVASPIEQVTPQPTDGEDQLAEQSSAGGATVGTGTSIALGCVAGTVVLVLIGLVFLVILMLLG